MASNASTYHRQSLTDKKEADILSLLKARSNTYKRKRCSQAGQPSSALDLQIEQEILLSMINLIFTNNKEGLEILKALVQRSDRYWSMEPLNLCSAKTIGMKGRISTHWLTSDASKIGWGAKFGKTKRGGQ